MVQQKGVNIYQDYLGCHASWLQSRFKGFTDCLQVTAALKFEE